MAGANRSGFMMSTSPLERVVTQFQEPFSSEGSRGKQACFSQQARVFAASRADYCNTSGKVIILGAAGVGKTSLMQRYCNDEFDPTYKATIGVDFEVEKFQILGRPFSLQLWDTAGNERFRSITKAYFRGAHCVILAFDMSEAHTLDSVRPWFADAQEHCNTTFDTFVVGCKLDKLSPDRYKDIEGLAMAMAQNIGGEFWPTSSLKGDNVDSFFQRVACVAFERVASESNRSKREETVVLGSALIDTPTSGKRQTSAEKGRQCCK